MRLPVPTTNTRLGFYYYPDTYHYTESDLRTWLSELRALGACWLTLPAPPDRAIPESFLKGLLSARIEPLLHLIQPFDTPLHLREVRVLFQAYQSWGVHFITLFDRPNSQRAWSSSHWSQANLAERFLDNYLPLAICAQEAGLIPVFPPLEPAGDYWDMVFLRQAIRGIERRGGFSLLEPLVLGAYAWPGNRPLNWGAGGPERWPAAHPYCLSSRAEDQCGFRIFDWYQAIARAELNHPAYIILLGAGCRPGDHQDQRYPPIDEASHAQRNLAIADLMTSPRVVFDEEQTNPSSPLDRLESVPPEVLACNFWLLSATKGSLHASSAWFQPDGHTLPIVLALRQQIAKRNPNSYYSHQPAEAGTTIATRLMSL
jgi:hypothetical protein